MSAYQLRKGENRPIPTQSVVVSCHWVGVVDREADLIALLLTGGSVRSDDDLVFYNQPSAIGGAVALRDKEHLGGLVEASVQIDLAALPEDLDRVAIALSVDDDRLLAELGPYEIELAALDGTAIAGFAITDMTTEAAAVVLEIYRRGDGWRIRAVGQGYPAGLARLVQDFGVAVDDQSTPPAG